MLSHIKTHQGNSLDIILLALLSCRGITMCKQLNNFTDMWRKKRQKIYFWPDRKLKQRLKTYQVEKTYSSAVKYHEPIDTVANDVIIYEGKKKPHFILAACALWPGNGWSVTQQQVTTASCSLKIKDVTNGWLCSDQPQESTNLSRLD